MLVVAKTLGSGRATKSQLALSVFMRPKEQFSSTHELPAVTSGEPTVSRNFTCRYDVSWDGNLCLCWPC